MLQNRKITLTFRVMIVNRSVLGGRETWPSEDSERRSLIGAGLYKGET